MEARSSSWRWCFGWVWSEKEGIICWETDWLSGWLRTRNVRSLWWGCGSWGGGCFLELAAKSRIIIHLTCSMESRSDVRYRVWFSHGRWASLSVLDTAVSLCHLRLGYRATWTPVFMRHERLSPWSHSIEREGKMLSSWERTESGEADNDVSWSSFLYFRCIRTFGYLLFSTNAVKRWGIRGQYCRSYIRINIR
jgi:hypothetical protein